MEDKKTTENELDTMEALEDGESVDVEAMDFSHVEEAPEFELPKARIAYVMLIVAVLCGGNGIGIVAAGLYWKAHQNLTGAIGIVIAATVIALAVVALIVVIKKHLVKKKLGK